MPATKQAIAFPAGLSLASTLILSLYLFSSVEQAVRGTSTSTNPAEPVSGLTLLFAMAGLLFQKLISTQLESIGSISRLYELPVTAFGVWSGVLLFSYVDDSSLGGALAIFFCPFVWAQVSCCSCRCYSCCWCSGRGCWCSCQCSCCDCPC